MNRKVSAVLFWLFMVAGVSGLAYPFAMNYFHNLNYSKQLKEYSHATTDIPNKEELLEEARAFNEARGVGYTYGDYKNLLKVEGTNAMGVLNIPSIQLHLPILYGYETDTLFKGAGHMQETSLPIGGKGTHAVLTGHSGLPDQRMFDNLPKLKKGDVVEVNVLGDTIAYEIFYTETIAPDDFNDKIQIDEDRDLLTLITCTPYSINTHRFIATGERIDYVSPDSDLGSSIVPISELLKWLIPWGVGVGFATFVAYRMGRVKKEKIGE